MKDGYRKGDRPLERKEREAVRMAQVFMALATTRDASDRAAEISTREERRRNFLQRRGVPYPAPRPSWAHEQDRKSFNADWQAERQAHQARQSTQRTPPTPAPSHAKKQDRPTVEPDLRREAFKAMRRQQNQTRGMERGFDQGARRTSFARTIDL